MISFYVAHLRQTKKIIKRVYGCLIKECKSLILYRGHKTTKCHYYQLFWEMKETFIKWKLLSTIHDKSKKENAKDNGIIIFYSSLLLTVVLVKNYLIRDLKFIPNNKEMVSREKIKLGKEHQFICNPQGRKSL